MKKILFSLLILGLICVALVEAQMSKEQQKQPMPRWSSSVTSQQKAVLQELIDGMVMVEGGTFTMGATTEQGSDAESDETPTHRVTLSDYMIGKTEVTQEQWEAVMGSNPSYFKGSNLPVEEVSWNDCQEFIEKLNSLTGLSFRLPTEAEWEYAARGGAKSCGYKYSGSNDLDAVAWYTKTTNDKGTMPVATKRANELGLYDMSGNVWEWCSDWYGDYSSSHQTNPKGSSTSFHRVIRDGGWLEDARYCRVSDRYYGTPSISINSCGLRLALEKQGREMTIRSDAAGDEVYLDGAKIGVTPLATNLSFGSYVIELRRSGKSVQKEVNVTASGSVKDILLTFGPMPRWSSSVTSQQKAVLQELIDGMVMVEGGTFTMGATTEQGSNAYSDEKPTHQVTLSDYMIGETEVTQEQWEAVMGSNPSYFKGSNLPVEQVSWNDCQEFIKRLNNQTGLSFRLPTEAEWEYAARGGAKSLGYKYSGSNDIDAVAWYCRTTNDKGTKPVATKQANDLGLYDMSGNVWEWCSDRNGAYSSSHQTNPKGSSTGSDRMLRGGGWFSGARNCRVSDRSYYNPSFSEYCLGLRLAL